MLQKFLPTSSIHGLSYLGADWATATRLFWLSSVAVSAASAILLIKGNYDNWKNQPSAVNSVDYELVEVGQYYVSIDQQGQSSRGGRILRILTSLLPFHFLMYL